MKGCDALIGYLESVGYKKEADALRISLTEFEKYADDAQTALMTAAKYVSLGPEPLIAYYYAKQAEIRNLRIILACRRLGMPGEQIRQRVRAFYV